MTTNPQPDALSARLIRDFKASARGAQAFDAIQRAGTSLDYWNGEP